MKLVNLDDKWIRISASKQTLTVFAGKELVAVFPVSTAKQGLGCDFGSNCTPIGWHRIKCKIGTDLPICSVFKARRFTGEFYLPTLSLLYPRRDWILSRILWLDGLEPGLNKCGRVDTLRRYIYIHGTADEHLIGIPASHGCIRMTNANVIELFRLVPAGIPISIVH